MNRRILLKSLFGLPIVLLFASKATSALRGRKGFMLRTVTASGVIDFGTIKTEVEYLASKGVNIVRFPLYFNNVPSIEGWLNRVDQVLTICEQWDIVLVLDMHHPGRLAGSTIENANDFISKWSVISQRFSNRSRIWYDLCNEPQSRTPEGFTWREVALRAAQAIRQQDKRNKIVFAAEGTTTRSASRFTPLPGITNQVLQFHFYNWSDLQFNVAPAYPSASYTKENLQSLLQEVSDAGKRHNLPIYIGEVAINRNHPNAPRFLRDFTSICEQLDIHLTIHAFREDPMWNYESTPTWNVLENWLQRR